MDFNYLISTEREIRTRTILHSLKALLPPCDDEAESRNAVSEISHQTMVASEGALSLLGLPDEILCTIGSFLDAQSLAVCRQLNQKYKFLFSMNQVGWSERWHELCERKVRVDSNAASLFQSTASSTDLQATAMYAYFLSCQDARFRRYVRLDELCFDVKKQIGTIWDFRFKEAAGPEWTYPDPWYVGREARKLIFLPCGAVKQLAIQKDVDTESPSIQIMEPFFDSHDGGLEVRWKFIEAPLDLPKGVRGSYIRLNVAGRDLPTYVVQRSPNGNWGFLLENCWGIFASFELPPKRNPDILLDDLFAVMTRDDLAGEDSIGVHLRGRKRKRTSDPFESSLLEDELLPVTNKCQWREALLYNLGASSLPEGDSDNAYVELDPEI